MCFSHAHTLIRFQTNGTEPPALEPAMEDVAMMKTDIAEVRSLLERLVATNLCNGFDDKANGLPPPPMPSAELSVDAPAAPTAPRPAGLPRPIAAARNRPERVQSPSADMTLYNAPAPLPSPTDASYVRAYAV